MIKLKKFANSKTLLVVIILLASFLRLYNLANVPPHLTPDEASLGYNAYSILKTGKDEYGKFMPIIFKSFGDYKPGLYIYATVPFVVIFGLNETAVRLPSAISGIVAVYLVYLIVRKLFANEDQKAKNVYSLVVGLLLAISPWHIHFSRGAWEINLALTLTLAGIYFFFAGLDKQKYLMLSAAFFALTFVTYQGAKLSTGIVIIVLTLLYWRDLFKLKAKGLLVPVFIGFLVSLPIILSLFSGKTGRLAVFSVFSYPRPQEYIQTFLHQGGEKIGSLDYYLFHSEGYNFLRGVLGRYFNHFSARFLFFYGDWQNPRHSPPNQGEFLIADVFLLISGLIVFLKEKMSREKLFVFLWMLLAPLSAALSRDQVHAVRSFNMLIPMIVINSFGLVWIFNALKSLKLPVLRSLVFVFAIFFYVGNFVYFIDAYFVHLPKHDSKYWEYGYKQIVETVIPIQNNYQKVLVQQSYAQPYIYFLFYGASLNPQKYDPAKYQASAKLRESETGDVGQVENLDNIVFGAIDWSVNRGDKGSLIVGDTVRIPDADSVSQAEFKLIKEIKYLNGKDTAFKIVEVKE